MGSCFVYFVMRNRGNDVVAPSETLLRNAKAAEKECRDAREDTYPEAAWDVYQRGYLEQLQTASAQQWIKNRAQEARIGNILLVCYEKDAAHCHRRLLAEEIARHDAEYEGELQHA